MSSRFSRYRFVVAVMLALTTVGSARAGTLTTVYFDGDHQGGSGNYGELFTPFDDVGLLAALTVTARTAIAPLDPFDPYAAGRPGTPSEGWIYLHFGGGENHHDPVGLASQFIPPEGSFAVRLNLAWLLGGQATGDGALPDWLPAGRAE